MSKKIELTQGKFALVDDSKFEELMAFKWYALNMQGRFYAMRAFRQDGKVKHVPMHSQILGKKSGYIIDHVNRATLDNRMSNLRHVTYQQNAFNRGNRIGKQTPKGVSFIKSLGYFKVTISKAGKGLFLGYFKEQEEAAKAYNNAAILHFGDFAVLNKI